MKSFLIYVNHQIVLGWYDDEIGGECAIQNFDGEI
jgi:hypothetical protein